MIFKYHCIIQIGQKLTWLSSKGFFIVTVNTGDFADVKNILCGFREILNYFYSFFIFVGPYK